ncbi:MAG: ATP-binding protein [Methylovulum sp.]|nr:ATP-binding protein [Methylovulum sp.]
MSVLPQANNGITLSIRSEAGQVSLLCEALYAVCVYASGNTECALKVQQAVAEALNNIIIHAYHKQPNQEITVCWSQEERQLRIQLIDTGTAMAYLPVPALPDFEAENSRGWWIIDACVDEYFYQTIGASIAGPVLYPGGSPGDIALLAAGPHTNILTFLKRF